MIDKTPSGVLMTADTVGGVWTYSTELVRWLCARGIRVTLATMGRPLTTAQAEEARSIPGLEVAESSFRLEWMDDPWSDVAAASEWLLRLVDRVQPDVVHVNGYTHAALPWKAPVVCVAHSCVLSWWRAVRGETAPPEYAQYRERVRCGLEAANVVAAPTAAMLSDLATDYGFSRPGRVIPNGRSTERLIPAAKEPFILASGRVWDDAKNIVAIDAIAPSLNWPVYVAGEERHPDGGEARLICARRLGSLSAREMAGWFSRASIYALPARYEPFGLSALEAALCGCALVLGDIASLREVWGDAALYVDPDDRDALREMLARIIRSDSLRADLAERARLRARRFTPDRMGMGYLEAYALARHDFESRRKAAA